MKSISYILPPRSKHLLELEHFRRYGANQRPNHRYFFNPEVANHLDEAKYTLNLAKACVTYLCQPHHDPELDQGSVATHLVAGVYRFHHFAADAWLKLTEMCCLSKEVDKCSEDWRELLCLVRNFLKTRTNDAYTPFDEKADLPRLKHIKDTEPDIYELLCREIQLRKKAEVRLFQLGKGTGFYKSAESICRDKPISSQLTGHISR